MRLFIVTLLSIFSATVLAQDFRAASWGETKEQVKASEDWELVEERNDGLLYRGKVAGLDALAYYFIIPSSDQLAAARYVFVDTYGEGVVKNPYIDDEYTSDDLRNLSDLLSQKYGEPTFGMTTATGTEWESETTTISLARNEDKDNYFNTIDYRSKELGDAWDEWVKNQNPL